MAHVPCINTPTDDASIYNTLIFHRSGFEHVSAIDVANPCGTPVYATVDGTVILMQSANNIQYFGNNYVAIKGNDGFYHLFGHMQSKNVTDGQQVKSGDVIGTVGTQGNSTGCHLHFSICATLQDVNYGGQYDLSVPMEDTYIWKFLHQKSLGKNNSTPNGSVVKQPPAKPAEPKWVTGNTFTLIPFAISVKSGSSHKFWINIEDKDINITSNSVLINAVTDSYNEKITGFTVYNQHQEELVSKNISKPIDVQTGKPITVKVQITLNKINEFSLLSRENMGEKILKEMFNEQWPSLKNTLKEVGWTKNGVNSLELSTTNATLMSKGKPIQMNTNLVTDNQTPNGKTDVKFTPELWSADGDALVKPAQPNSNGAVSSGVVSNELQFWEACKKNGLTPALIYMVSSNAYHESNFHSNILNTSPTTFADSSYNFHTFPGNTAIGLFQFYNDASNNADVADRFFQKYNYVAKDIIDGGHQISWTFNTELNNPRYAPLKSAIDAEKANPSTSYQSAVNLCKLWTKYFEIPYVGQELENEASRRCDGREYYYKKIVDWYN